MAGVEDNELQPIGPWPQGINNLDKEHALPKGALRAATNVDLDTQGWPTRRKGRTNRVSATRAHSLFATEHYLFALVDGVLKAYELSGNNLILAGTIKSGLGERYVSYTQHLEDVYWTNGIHHRRIADDLTDHPSGLATPHPPTAAASATGGLAAGDYEVTLTWRDVDGKESGASPPVVVTLESTGGILLTNFPTSEEDAAQLLIYVATPNTSTDDGDVYYLAYKLPAGATTLLLGAYTPGQACETLWLQPLPPGDIIRNGGGRNLIGSGPWLYWSHASRVGLMHHSHSMRFGEGIKMIEYVGQGSEGAGFFIADHKRTYFMSGGNSPKDAQKIVRYGHSAVPGTSIVAPGTAFGLDTTEFVAYWMASNGVPCLGLPGGIVQPLTEGRFATDTDSEHGASLYREVDGYRQLLTAMLAGKANTAGVSDSAVATVRSHSVTLD
jgi:hypothetical protein